MSISHDLQRSIKLSLLHHKAGAFTTRYDREKILMLFAKDLVGCGYKLRQIKGLKRKHIEAVTKLWQSKGRVDQTIKNRTSALRYLCEKINKIGVMPTNKELGIGNRSYIPKKNRAIHEPNFSGITNSHVLVSLELQRVFGLRREESLKIKPFLADKTNKLELLASWCKGGRGRVIPIRTDEQRDAIENAKLLAKKYGNSLVPENKSYIKHRYVYDKQVNRAGLKNLHGLRHAYAQQRYKELTGWEAPLNGGPSSKQLTKEQKAIDYQARIILTEELGHSREQITVNYLGR